ncbi:hypothetical protein HPB48_007142 [Haemaphysalis longicornis]|uniref:Uncharacterized protein n=1 Tax=Haemaphysalis longicornis TaxID=44386 RepID=A0A9J6FSK2_HAELO|nr:hypothetical protein HPB48_007142 [Haemaphysalis longicornis]
MPAAMALFDYIQGVEFGADLSEDNFVDTTVYTASQLNHEIATRNQIGNMTPLTGVLYALLNQFDLDGPGARIITSRCGHCNFRLRADEPVCMNGTCPVSMGQAEPQSSEEFDIPVMLNTLFLPSFWVWFAKVDEFKNFTDDDLTALKWKFLLERFKVQFKVQRNLFFLIFKYNYLS